MCYFTQLVFCGKHRHWAVWYWFNDGKGWFSCCFSLIVALATSYVFIHLLFLWILGIYGSKLFVSNVVVCLVWTVQFISGTKCDNGEWLKVNFNPYQSSVEVTSTVLLVVPGQMTSSNRHVILVFLCYLSRSSC